MTQVETDSIIASIDEMIHSYEASLAEYRARVEETENALSNLKEIRVSLDNARADL